jgi:NAD+ synthase (glutamine-hydrolysing)
LDSWSQSQKEGGFYNAYLFAEGKFRLWSKNAVANPDVFDEDRYFASASVRLSAFAGKRWEYHLRRCLEFGDFWSRPLYSTDPIRNQVEHGADLLINISASPYEMGKPRLRFQMLLDHVQKHRVPLVYVNLVGGNDDLLFDGNSLALGKNGNVIAQCRSFAEDLMSSTPNPMRTSATGKAKAWKTCIKPW